jgi:hypothetical protein
LARNSVAIRRMMLIPAHFPSLAGSLARWYVRGQQAWAMLDEAGCAV